MADSVSIGGTAFKVRPWPSMTVKPAIEWVQAANGNWSGSDRGAAQDIYESEFTVYGDYTSVYALQTAMDSNREGITLSSINAEIFAPNVDHTGSISCSVIDFGQVEQKAWAGAANAVISLTIKVRALSPTLLTPTPSLSTLRHTDGWVGDQSWEVGKAFTFNQTASYRQRNADIGMFRATYQQKRSEAQAILAYILVTARAGTVTFPLHANIPRPFGQLRGTGPFNCKITDFSISRKDLNRWLLDIEFREKV
jgi:hypothetical protein